MCFRLLLQLCLGVLINQSLLSSIEQQAARHKNTPAYRNVVPLLVYILLTKAAAATTVRKTHKNKRTRLRVRSIIKILKG
jgi:hypothetical protein